IASIYSLSSVFSVIFIVRMSDIPINVLRWEIDMSGDIPLKSAISPIFEAGGFEWDGLIEKKCLGYHRFRRRMQEEERW
ncbi:hypothetical protein PFISCL1PPCAC_20998, partial [Pristionchus fissidentatus]